ncbi:MAG: glycosyltransferase family 1 protein [Ideonella sp. WA131b]|nr:glycosyltransferase family 1 protein [Ideonella sp. WA131b]
MTAPRDDELTVDAYLPSRRSLRVAVVTETWPPEVNGVATTAARVVAELRERGHELQVLRPRQQLSDTAADEPGYAEVLMRGLPIPRYPQLKMGLPARRALLRQWGLRRPDVVHIVTEGPLGWSALQAAMALGLPVVSDFRTNFQAYSRHYGVAWLQRPIMGYLRKFHNRTACTMVPTEALRAELLAEGYANLRVVSRGVDTGLFNPAHRSEDLRRQWGVGPLDMVAVHVGRIAPEKNLETLLAAHAAMQQRDPRVKLVFVGDGPARMAMQQRCPQAHFAGLQRGLALAAHYASADVFLFPSVTETWGNVLPEAMASGLAVLAFDCAAAAQLVHHGHNGLLARVGDEAGFCATAARLAGALGEARALGAGARQAALKLDWGRIAREVEAEYLAAMAAAPQPRAAALAARAI